VGEIIIEWVDSSLVVITETHFYSQTHALCCLDLVDDEYVIDRVQMKKLFDMIKDWNATKWYDPIQFNCQKFTSHALLILGLPDPVDIKNPDSKVKQFIDSLGDLDKSTLEYKFTPTGENKSITIKTHAQLDELCFDKKIQEYTEDWKVLKAMDRVFWLRYIGICESIAFSDKKEFYEELSRNYEPGEICYFGDPKEKTGYYAPRMAYPNQIFHSPEQK